VSNRIDAQPGGRLAIINSTLRDVIASAVFLSRRAVDSRHRARSRLVGVEVR
jgi:hypothetical protein